MPRQRPESVRRPPAPTRLAQQHARNLIDSLGRLYRAPLASLLTASVIGITLALPAGLHLLLKNLDALSFSWQGTVQASLYLADNVSESDGHTLTAQISKRDGVAKAHYISRKQALSEFKSLSGFGEALDALGDNPLPAVIAVQPASNLNASAVSQLVDQLGALPQVARAQLDRAWLQRLYAVLSIARRVVTLIAVLLACAVVFIVGNTIRLDIENRREEIEVMKLLGASDGFIRRPFLYSGFWYGLIGGVLALILLTICLLAVSGPVHDLAGLYGSSAGIAGLGFGGCLALLGIGVGLGWLGSAVTVHRRLRGFEPR